MGETWENFFTQGSLGVLVIPTSEGAAKVGRGWQVRQ